MARSTIVHPAATRSALLALAAKPMSHADLVRGALLVALEDFPSIDIEAPIRTMDEFAGRVTAAIQDESKGLEPLDALRRVLFEEEGFCGDDDDYYDPRNVYLHDVVARRRGMPLSLSIVFLYVAERVGVETAGIGFPGHFLVRVQRDERHTHVDPFHGGLVRDARLLALLFERAGIVPTPEHLRDWTPVETLVRMLSNLVNVYSRLGDAKRAMSAEARRQQLARIATEGSLSGRG